MTIFSLLAERSSERVSGIIMMFPSTIVLGFFFLGLATSPDNVSRVIPATLIPLGIVIFSSVIYIYISNFYSTLFNNKNVQIFISLVSCIMIWFVLVAPFAIYKFSNLAIGVAGFFLLILATQLMMGKMDYVNEPIRPQYTWTQLAIRAVFTGSTIALVVLLGKVLNPFWGGVFTMFPSATFATLIILHYYYSPSELLYFMKSAPLGSISLFVYTISVMLLFPNFGIWIGTLLSYLASLAVSLLLVKFRTRKIER